MNFERNVDIVRAMQSGLIYTNVRSARTGRKDASYANGLDPDPTSDLPGGYIWVREGEDGDRGQTVALIVGVRSDILDAPILIGERTKDGSLCAIQADINPKTLAAYGSGLPAVGVPNVPSQWQRQPLDSLYFSPGRTRASTNTPDTLYVTIEPFMYNGQWYGGFDYDVGSSNVPGSANEAVWVIITVDPDNVGHTRAATETVIASVNSLPLSDPVYGLDAIVIPTGEIPVLAATLLNGQTAIRYSRFVDARYWLTPRVQNAVSRTITTDDTVDDDADNIYLNVDASGGAVSITLPTAASYVNRVVHVTKVDSSAYMVTVVPDGAETIIGDTSLVIEYQWTSMALQSNGTEWVIT